jgi:predicted nucleic acid-binding Zn ribbon protein
MNEDKIMNPDETFNWLEALTHESIGSPNTAPMETNTASIEASIGSPNTAPIEKRARKPRHYKEKFGGFCVVCNTFFPAKTSKKKTCSESCKSRLKRQREKAQAVQQDMLWALGDLQQMTRSDDKILRKKAKTMIAQLREQVLMTCEEVGLKPLCPL